MAAPILSICITTVEERKLLLNRMLFSIQMSIHRADAWESVEIHICEDNISLARKRNKLLLETRGKYICFVDDDDEVSVDYVGDILYAITNNGWPDCIGLVTEESRDGAYHKILQYGITIPINHLCPIRNDIALRSCFWCGVPYGSDQPYWKALQVAGYLDNPVLIPRVLYYYHWSSTNTLTQLRGYHEVSFLVNPLQFYLLVRNHGHYDYGSIFYQEDKQQVIMDSVWLKDNRGNKVLIPLEKLVTCSLTRIT